MVKLVEKGPLKLSAKLLETSGLSLKDFEIAIGKLAIEEEWEPLGPTPFPSIASLRDWDHILLKRYKPLYMPFCDLCCLCTFGKCDLSRDKRGACGLNMAGQQSRIVLIACCIGASTHTAHARDLVEKLIERYGRDHPINIGGEYIYVEAPITRLVCGIKPKTLGDLEDVLDYCEKQIAQLLSATHTGQEGDNIDFESKVFHAGMIDHVALEIADIAQISALNFPKADPEAPLIDLGIGNIDISKPVIMCVGHNVIPTTGIIDYILDNNLDGKIEVVGLCCTAWDTSRYSPKIGKIVGPISWQLRFIRTGIPDVIIVDEQCVRTNLIEEARKINAILIATSDKNCQGLPDLTKENPSEIINKLLNGDIPGALIFDREKVGEVAVKTAMALAPKRFNLKIFPIKEKEWIVSQAKKCKQCRECERACPNNLQIAFAMKFASNGDFSKLSNLYDYCVGCGRCESACPEDLPIITLMNKASEETIREEKFKCRTGRGAIRDTEIRKVGRDIVLGTIPGVIAFVGCANYANGGKEVVEMVEEFLKRRYIVVASGCSAMTIGMYKNSEGKTLYEEYPGDFDAGCLVNVGSCVSNSHISGAAIKIANIFAKRNLRANYKEIADYILNRIGAVGVAWGAMSQKAASIASGFWRLGVPVIVGPHGSKYRRMLLGRKENKEDWMVYDARTGEKVYVGPVPEHLFYAAETKEEAIVMIAKLCMRANDTPQGRAIKLTHYVNLYRKFYGVLPEDLPMFVRVEADIPITMKDEIVSFLKEKGWEEKVIPDPTLLKEKVVKKIG
ncbi:MAG: CO dehydrogenase/acetyl-CoA synthase complex subunit alpha [Nitrososphaerota archaeon]